MFSANQIQQIHWNQVPLKLSLSTRFMVNLTAQNFTPLLFMKIFTQDWVSKKIKLQPYTNPCVSDLLS